MTQETTPSAPAKDLDMLLLATVALRDIGQGYPQDEPGVKRGKGIRQIIEELTLHLNARGALDAKAKNTLLASLPGFEFPPEPPKHEVRAQALRALIDDGLGFAECIHAFGEEDSPFIEAAREEYVSGSDGDVDIDQTTVVSQSDDGAYVLGWMWVSNSDVGIYPWDDVLESFKKDFAAFRRDPVVDAIVAEIAAEIGKQPNSALLSLFKDNVDALLSEISASAANTCGDDEDEQDEAIGAAEKLLDAMFDHTVEANVAVVLRNHGSEDGARIIRDALKQ